MKGLCVYVEGGKGHFVPAKAVMEAMEKLSVEMQIEEFFDYLDIRWMGRINRKYWRLMLRFPFLERKLSKHNDANSNGMEMAINFAKKHCERMLRANLDEYRPDFIFATHPYASTILSAMLKDMKIDIPVYYFATDVFSAPVAAISDDIRKFFIATEEGAECVMKMGQRKETIEICPFPIQSSISEHQIQSKKEAREKLGLDKELFTLQLNLGGEGIGSLYLFRKLLAEDVPMQMVVLGGIDKKMTRELEQIVKANKKSPVKVYIKGFVNNVNDYLAASDIIAGRAGINTIVEAIYARRPFLITELVYTVIPSARFVEKYHVGWDCSEDKEKQVKTVLYYAKNNDELIALDENFSNVPIKYGAERLAKLIIEDVDSIHS